MQPKTYTFRPSTQWRGMVDILENGQSIETVAFSAAADRLRELRREAQAAQPVVIRKGRRHPLVADAGSHKKAGRA